MCELFHIYCQKLRPNFTPYFGIYNEWIVTFKTVIGGESFTEKILYGFLIFICCYLPSFLIYLGL